MTGPRIIHGARSEPTVRRVATVQKRRLLRQIGLRAADLDGIALGYLDLWARSQSKVELIDTYAAEHGFIGEDGSIPGWTAFYLAAVNTARLNLAKLEDHLRARGKRVPAVDLSQYRTDRRPA